MNTQPTQWILALESSTPHGGTALLRNGSPYKKILLQEGLRHGRELLASAQTLLKNENLHPSHLHTIAVSIGPGSYTGIRVGVMAAKALAYASNRKLAAVSSLAALAQTATLNNIAKNGDTILTIQNARRDEVYAAAYTIQNNTAEETFPDTAMTPEEAALLLKSLKEKNTTNIIRTGSSFTTYQEILGPPTPPPPGTGTGTNAEPNAETGLDSVLTAILGAQTDNTSQATNLDGRVDPAAVGILGHRQIVLEKYADPMTLQPVYARRDPESDWRHDHLITGTK